MNNPNLFLCFPVVHDWIQQSYALHSSPGKPSNGNTLHFVYQVPKVESKQPEMSQRIYPSTDLGLKPWKSKLKQETPGPFSNSTLTWAGCRTIAQGKNTNVIMQIHTLSSSILETHFPFLRVHGRETIPKRHRWPLRVFGWWFFFKWVWMWP